MFLLYPFEGDGLKFCDDTVKKAVEYAGYEPEDAKKSSGGQPILEDILKGIARARIVIGVLTDKNPNVYWEIGVAHTWKPATQVLTIARACDVDKAKSPDKAKFPFNLQGFRHVVVDDGKPAEAKEIIVKKLHAVVREHDALVEEAVLNARNALGPNELRLLVQRGKQLNFVLNAHAAISGVDLFSTPEGYELSTFTNEKLSAGPRLLATHIDGLSVGQLCRLGVLACNTAQRPEVIVEFSFYWTPLGNRVLELLGVIDRAEVERRWNGIPEAIRFGRGAHVFGPIVQT